MVTILGFMGSVGVDGSFGNDNNEKSVLGAVGTAITPVFEPFGIEEDNWPASVALFTGLFAKEAIVGTLNSLYGIDGAKTVEKTRDERRERLLQRVALSWKRKVRMKTVSS